MLTTSDVMQKVKYGLAIINARTRQGAKDFIV